MTIKAFQNHYPDIHSSAYIDDMAYVSGQTKIGEDCSVWPMAVIRGDVNTISIGDRTNVQDGAVLHVTHAGEYTSPTGSPLIIGDDVTIGHNAVLHACTVGNRCLIGMSATIMDNAVIEDDVIIAAGSLVPPNRTLESGYLWKGNPIQKSRLLTEKERSFLSYSAKNYAKLAKQTQAS